MREVRVPPVFVLLAIAAFTLLPLAELGLLIWSAVEVGFWWTVLACIVTAVAGSLIARWQGAVTLRSAQEALARGELPGGALLDGALVLVGGVLLLTPGFVTDLMGLACLLPPTRAVVKAVLRRWWRSRSGAPPRSPVTPVVVDVQVIREP